MSVKLAKVRRAGQIPWPCVYKWLWATLNECWALNFDLQKCYLLWSDYPSSLPSRCSFCWAIRWVSNSCLYTPTPEAWKKKYLNMKTLKLSSCVLTPSLQLELSLSSTWSLLCFLHGVLGAVPSVWPWAGHFTCSPSSCFLLGFEHHKYR